ncbi:MAG: hypothetical protein CL609_15390 [Anaerolineaceae bacterium]|nr:hypothetical protein [Anaerolineaceae bacterium]
MKKELLARLIIILFISLAIAIPVIGRLKLSVNHNNVVELHARMPENGGWSLSTIEVKAGKPLKLHITSDDVMHGFSIGKSDQPALEITPGEFVDTTLIFDTPGRYTFYCDRWCGPNHWRMRGTIVVTGDNQTSQPEPQPLFLKLGIDIDSPSDAETIPSKPVSAENGAKFQHLLPEYALQRDTYNATSPAKLWMRLRKESTLANLPDSDLWDIIAWIWQQNTTNDQVINGQEIFAKNCAACHGETGEGDGVMVRGLPVWDPGNHNSGNVMHEATGEGLVRPPDFTDPIHLLGVSPALLEGKIIRGGMGTGMPYWGPIFTNQQIDSLISYLYTFAWNTRAKNSN